MTCNFSVMLLLPRLPVQQPKVQSAYYAHSFNKVLYNQISIGRKESCRERFGVKMQQYTNFFFMMCVLIVGRIKKVTVVLLHWCER